MPICKECKWYTTHDIIPGVGECCSWDEVGRLAKVKQVKPNEDASNCPRFELSKTPGRYIET